MYKARSPSPAPSEMLKSFIDCDEVVVPRKPPPHVSKYIPRSDIVDSEAVTTMHHQPIRPTTVSSSSSSRGSMVSVGSISEDKEDDKESSSSSTDIPFKRKRAIYRKSQTQTIIEVPDDKPKAKLSRAYSLDSPLGVPHAYNPNEPLTNFPPKKSSSRSLARVRSIKATIGPLTKEVCEKLNMSLQLDHWQAKVLS